VRPARDDGVNDDAFGRVRPLLFTVAYDILGSAAEAEDVVQDTWLRWSSADRGDVRDPKAYLVRVTTNLALNRLRTARARRESYIGPWLPEPLLTSPDIAEDVEVAESVSMALLVVLETLSPLERAVFVLREVFGFAYAEIAETLGRSETTVRQLAHRAREHVEARRPRFAADARTRREVTERFTAATVTGDVEALLATLAPGVTLVTDGGGRAKAALRPIVGRRKVAAFLSAVASEGLTTPDLRVELVDVNGAPAVAARSGGRIFVVVQVDVGPGGLIEQVHVILNPDKLTGLEAPASLAVR
jgi:RNA polymerase sigma-70 factor (ECF subfamily)